MIPPSVRRFVEALLPWYDRAAEARHDERSNYIHERAIEVRVESEAVIGKGRDRIREAYQAYADGFRR
jgi:hypothetical protein